MWGVENKSLESSCACGISVSEGEEREDTKLCMVLLRQGDHLWEPGHGNCTSTSTYQHCTDFGRVLLIQGRCFTGDRSNKNNFSMFFAVCSIKIKSCAHIKRKALRCVSGLLPAVSPKRCWPFDDSEWFASNAVCICFKMFSLTLFVKLM